MMLLTFTNFPTAFPELEPPYSNGISIVFHSGCSVASIKAFLSFSVDINTVMLTEEDVLPEYVLPVIYSSVFLLSGNSEVFLVVCRLLSGYYSI